MGGGGDSIGGGARLRRAATWKQARGQPSHSERGMAWLKNQSRPGERADIVHPAGLAAQAGVLASLDQTAAASADLPGNVRSMILPGVSLTLAEVSMLKGLALRRQRLIRVGHPPSGSLRS